MSPARVSRLRHALLFVCALSVAWAAILVLTGGFVIHVFSISVSSRNPRNALIVALLSGGTAWALPMPGGRWRAASETSFRWFAWIGALPTRWPWIRRANPATMILLVALGVELAHWAAARPLWLDEEMIALNLRERSLVDLAGPLWLGQSAPFGWLAVQRAVVLTLGTSELALRLVPALFGTATVLAAYLIGGRWMAVPGAAVFVLLCSFGRWMTHYPFEVKHYSADVFWALLLPALAVWTLEPDQPAERTRRIAVWWISAAVGHWLANGALLVTPACALVLLVTLWRRKAWRDMRAFTLLGAAWLASFGLHYVVSIRHTVNSEFLRSYWSGGLPPESAGLLGTLSWLAAQAGPLAENPGGTSLWLLFWLSAASGFALTPRRTLGVLLGAITLSAFVLGGLGVVPLLDRLALWIVPSLYLGVALSFDGAMRFGRNAYVHRSWTRALLALLLALVGLRVASDIFWRGKEDMRVARPLDSKQRLDDRAAVRWLMKHRQDGDVFVTTHLAVPALWWYGRIPMSNPDSAGTLRPDQHLVLEVEHAEPGAGCQRNQLREALKGRRRVLVYAGFPEPQKAFDELMIGRLGELGVIKTQRRFADIGRAAVIDLGGLTDSAAVGTMQRAAERQPAANALDGCIVVRPATRW
jgi:hypothetical protein